MGDGKSIASYDYNLEVTGKVVEMAHAIGVMSRVSWAASGRSKR